jgi:hypothetical protein
MKKLFLLTLLVGLAVATQAQTVYASEKGTKYHTADCNLSGDANAIKVADAKKKGKGACGVCKPDEHMNDKVTQCTGITADKSRCKRMTSAKGGKCYQHTGK